MSRFLNERGWRVHDLKAWASDLACLGMVLIALGVLLVWVLLIPIAALLWPIWTWMQRRRHGERRR